MPVGSSRERVADVRIVAATNENMEKAIADGRFREDLYHRLGEFEIHQPSLCECPEDILPLANFFRENILRSFIGKERASRLKRNGCCSHTPGQVTSGSCRTRLDGQY